MRKHLQIALMAGSVIATSFSLITPPAQAASAEEGSATQLVATTDDNGRKIYVNEYVEVSRSPKNRQGAEAQGAQPNRLAYWSAKESRWKPVPPARMGRARSAAAEVNQYLHQESSPENGSSVTANFLRSGQAFTQQDVDAAIDQAAARHNVDPNLVRSVIKVESNFNPNAVSRKGAMGLMQLMPSTARSLHVKNPFDPQQNVDAGVRHLKQLLESYGGNVKLSLAAYNAGAGAVARSSGIPRFSETQNYVKRITNLYYGSSESGSHILGSVVHDPVRVQRDARGVLYISNTD
ncbi:MAG TPA: lytic transglycosylase domain-containing protein [Terriglobales bacterium]|nr:lytic transglycosylase domain-containing protein [Terriglobales bacterium]